MPKFQAITKTHFVNLRWRRVEKYHFAARDTVVPVVAQELPRACMSLPLAFFLQGQDVICVAVLGFQPGRNLFVTADGNWIGPYIPAAYRGYPFAVADTHDGAMALCVDMESGLVDAGPGEPFFDDTGEPTPAVQKTLAFLHQVRTNEVATRRMCAALHAEGLIVPWSIVVKDGQGDRAVEGLYRIDEAKLHSLDRDALYRLHQAGALAAAFCQLLSMQHLPTLGRLAEAHARAGVKESLPVTESGELDLSFLNEGGTIHFGSD